MADYLEGYRKKHNIDKVRPILANVLYGLGLEDKIKNFLTSVSSEKTAFGTESPVAKAAKYVGGAIGNMLMPEEIDPLAMATYGGMKAKGYKPNEPMGQFSNLADKKVRFEIDDSAMKFKPDAFRAIDNSKTIVQGSKLGDVLEHEELFKNYPELKETPVFVSINKKNQPGGYFSDDGIHISATNMDEAKRFLSHETQHPIQEKEGFARGGSEDEFLSGGIRGQMSNESRIYADLFSDKVSKETLLGNRAWDKYNKPWNDLTEAQKTALVPEWILTDYNRILDELKKTPKTAFETYKRLGGEIEARDVENRLYFNPEQRRSTGVYTSENIPVEDWIVK
jgi:hypothetical protein